MARLGPEFTEADILEEDGVFFQTRGAVCFTPESQLAPDAYRNAAEVLAVSSRHGVVFMSDPRGVYAAHTNALVASARPDGDDDMELPALTAAEVGSAQISADSLASLSLSPDERLLAVAPAAGDAVSLFTVHSLVEAGTPAQPCASWQLPAGHRALQLAWRPGVDAPKPAQCLVVTSGGALLLGQPGGGLQPLQGGPADARSAAWSPDGQLLAVAAGDEVYVRHWDSSASFTARITLLAAASADEASVRQWDSGVRFIARITPDEEGQQLQTDSVHWTGPAAVLVSSSAQEGEEESDQAPMQVLHWAHWAPGSADPVGLTLAAFFPNNVVPGAAAGAAAAGGPRLAAAAVPGVGVTVTAHRKSPDEHIKVVEAAAQGGKPPRLVDIVDDRLAARVPNAAEDADNFVLGLGVDLTSMQLAVHNPLDPAEPDFPPSPLLVAATSDAKLRFYTLSHLRRPLAGLVAPATPISAGMPPLAAPDAVPAADAGGGITAAAQGGLPASSDAEEAGVAVAAAAAQLPDSDDESLGENSDSGAAQAELPESSDEEFGRYTSDEEGGSVMAAAAARLPDSDGESFRDGSETESSGVAAAARAGLPESDEESLGEGEQTASSRHPALGSSASKPATSGWGADLLSANAKASQAAAAATAKHIEEAKGGGSASSAATFAAASAPALSFGVQPAATAAVLAAPSGWEPDLLSANAQAADAAAAKTAKQIEEAEGGGSASSAATVSAASAAPYSFGMQPAASSAAPSPAASGWGADLLSAKAQAAEAAAAATAKQLEEAKGGGSTPSAAASTAAAAAAPFSFGVQPAASTAAAAPAASGWGADLLSANAKAASEATAAAARQIEEAKRGGTAASATASTSAFSFGIQPAASTAAAAPASSAAPAASAAAGTAAFGGGFSFGQANTSLPAAPPSGIPSAFGMSAFGQPAAKKPSGIPSAFGFSSATPSAASAAPFSFGSATAPGSSVAAAKPASGFGFAAAEPPIKSGGAVGFSMSTAASASSTAADGSSQAAGSFSSRNSAAPGSVSPRGSLDLSRATSGPLRQAFGLAPDAQPEGSADAPPAQASRIPQRPLTPEKDTAQPPAAQTPTGIAASNKTPVSKPAQPPLPFQAQVVQAQQAAASALGGPQQAKPDAAAKRAAVKQAQPPLPSRSQVAQAQQAASSIFGSQQPAKPGPAAAKPAQPPLPSHAQAAQAQQAASAVFGAPQAAKPAQPPLPSRTHAAQAQKAAASVFGAPQPPKPAQQQRQLFSFGLGSKPQPSLSPPKPAGSQHPAAAFSTAPSFGQPAAPTERPQPSLPSSAAPSTQPETPEPPPMPEVSRPEPQLQGEGKEAEALEADFLGSLFETRKLEAELSTAFAHVLDPQASEVATAAGFACLERDVGSAADEATKLRQGLDAQRATFASLQDAAKADMRRLAALADQCTRDELLPKKFVAFQSNKGHAAAGGAAGVPHGGQS